MPCMLVISNKGPLTPMAQLDWHFGKAAFTTLLLYAQKTQLKFNTLTCHFRALLNTWKVLHNIPFDCKSIWHEAMKSILGIELQFKRLCCIVLYITIFVFQNCSCMLKNRLCWMKNCILQKTFTLRFEAAWLWDQEQKYCDSCGQHFQYHHHAVITCSRWSFVADKFVGAMVRRVSRLTSKCHLMSTC